MTQFLASILEQMDLALDQLAVNDANYKRFTLMLVDNVVELTLHQHASDTARENEMWGPIREPKHPQTLVEAAMAQNFDDKAKLAAHTGLISAPLKESIVILHSFRNQVYHRGLTHEAILPAISLFYFRNACDLLKSFRPQSISWGSNTTIPHRARKYLGADPFLHLGELFPQACDRLREVSEGFVIDIPSAFADHVTSTIEEADHSISFLADDSPDRMTREEVLVHSQVWPFAFTDEAKSFAREKACPAETVGGYIEWLKENYPWRYRKDPIPGWKQRSAALRREEDPHRALSLYHGFMAQTEELRSSIHESAVQLDGYIQQQIDIARGK